jgi:glycosyltransferase involved in cell wall biosynthesis
MDIQAAVSQGAGIGRYVRLLAEHLVKAAGADDLDFFYFDFMRRGLSTPLANARGVRWCPGRVVQACWKTIDWPPFDWFAGPADLYHFPNFIMPPLSRGKCVVSIHDASFLRFPEFTERGNLAYLRSAIKSTVRRADAIITISHFSASELGYFFPEARPKINVIYPGVAEHILHSTAQAGAGLRHALGLRRKYLLTVGTLEPRKNIELLIRLFEAMKEFQGELVIVGRRGWKYSSTIDRMRSSSRAHDIRLLENINDRELAAIYAGAELFLFPSHYEGFGFPPLEAMVCGTPVISSTGGSLKEALGEGALLIDSFDVLRWTRAAEMLINDKQVRQMFIEKGQHQVAKYSWTETARQTMALYRKIAYEDRD